jgi:hypothetical protein
MNVYKAREDLEPAMKAYNDQTDRLVNVVQLCKNRILELEKNTDKQNL